MSPALYLGLPPDPWPDYQWNEAVDLWGTAVDARLEERRLEAFDPPKQPMKPVPVHDLNSALGLDDDGTPIDWEFAQQEELLRRYGKDR